MSNSHIQDKQENLIVRDRYVSLMMITLVAIILVFAAVCLVLEQVLRRPLPVFSAQDPAGQTMMLAPSEQPNLVSTTLLTWASKAAVAAYTFDFVNYNKQFAIARPYFTPAGWSDYLASVSGLINTITQNQLFVNGVISGSPVISNQGDIPGRGYAWRVQIPFLVTYQSANSTEQKSYTVILTIIRVPTTINPRAIGIDQFVMR